MRAPKYTIFIFGFLAVLFGLNLIFALLRGGLEGNANDAIGLLIAVPLIFLIYFPAELLYEIGLPTLKEGHTFSLFREPNTFGYIITIFLDLICFYIIAHIISWALQKMRQVKFIARK